MSDAVSRETSREELALFGGRLGLAHRYAEILADDGVVRGLIGPREVPRIWSRHILNCAVAVAAVREGESVADVGSGAGLPGLVWAIARPDIEMTCVEPLQRRTVFLEEVVARLGLDNVTVTRARAESVSSEFDVVTSRAVANLEKLAAWCMPLVRPGGRMVALKGRSATEEVEAAAATIEKLGGGSIVVSSFGDWLDVPTTVVEIART